MDHRPELSYTLVPDWPRVPEGRTLGHVPGVAVDSRDRVHVISREEKSVIVFDLDGNIIGSWGEGIFTNPHGLHITPDDCVFISDANDHTVRKFTPEGELIQTLGTEGCEGEEGKPFHRPTAVAIAPSGEIYVSDGYAGFRVHKFSPDGELLLSWGEQGEGPGQFAVPHSLWVGSDGRVWVADRENHRIQIFSPDGEYLVEWWGFDMPCTVFIDGEGIVYVPQLTHRLTILDLEGTVLGSWGGDEDKAEPPARFASPHTACTDSRGDLYIGEVLEGARLLKFTRV